MPKTLTPTILDAIERDQAARAVDPLTLDQRELVVKVFALQARVSELEGIATYLANLLQAIEQATLTSPPDDRAYRRLVLDLTDRRWRCATPVVAVESSTVVEPETGAASFMRRAL